MRPITRLSVPSVATTAPIHPACFAERAKNIKGISP